MKIQMPLKATEMLEGISQLIKLQFNSLGKTHIVLLSSQMNLLTKSPYPKFIIVKNDNGDMSILP